MSAAGVPLIESQTDLEALFARLRGAPLLAVDTEAASFHRFIDRVYLLQISSRDETAVVDPLAVESLAPLALVLADPEVEIVFHDADYDLRLLDREYGFRATGVFDTRIAAQLLNEPGVGLAALLEKYMGVRLDKRFQRADWSARPLSPEMLEYAASDTRYLPALRDILRAQLEARGRLGWAAEEFALLDDIRWSSAERGARLSEAQGRQGAQRPGARNPAGAAPVARGGGPAKRPGHLPDPQQRADARRCPASRPPTWRRSRRSRQWAASRPSGVARKSWRR